MYTHLVLNHGYHSIQAKKLKGKPWGRTTNKLGNYHNWYGDQAFWNIINPWHSAQWGLMVVGHVCMCVCVCLLLNISLLKWVIVLTHTQWHAYNCQKFSGIFLKWLHSRATRDQFSCSIHNETLRLLHEGAHATLYTPCWGSALQCSHYWGVKSIDSSSISLLTSLAFVHYQINHFNVSSTTASSSVLKTLESIACSMHFISAVVPIQTTKETMWLAQYLISQHNLKSLESEAETRRGLLRTSCDRHRLLMLVNNFIKRPKHLVFVC